MAHKPVHGKPTTQRTPAHLAKVPALWRVVHKHVGKVLSLERKRAAVRERRRLVEDHLPRLHRDVLTDALVVDDLEEPVLLQSLLRDLKDSADDVRLDDVDVRSQLVAVVVLSDAVDSPEVEVCLRHTRPLRQDGLDVLVGHRVSRTTVEVKLHHRHLRDKVIELRRRRVPILLVSFALKPAMCVCVCVCVGGGGVRTCQRSSHKKKGDNKICW
jgi:hypothetical protein